MMINLKSENKRVEDIILKEKIQKIGDLYKSVGYISYNFEADIERSEVSKLIIDDIIEVVSKEVKKEDRNEIIKYFRLSEFLLYNQVIVKKYNITIDVNNYIDFETEGNQYYREKADISDLIRINIGKYGRVLFREKSLKANHVSRYYITGGEVKYNFTSYPHHHVQDFLLENCSFSARFIKDCDVYNVERFRVDNSEVSINGYESIKTDLNIKDVDICSDSKIIIRGNFNRINIVNVVGGHIELECTAKEITINNCHEVRSINITKSTVGDIEISNCFKVNEIHINCNYTSNSTVRIFNINTLRLRIYSVSVNSNLIIDTVKIIEFCELKDLHLGTSKISSMNHDESCNLVIDNVNMRNTDINELTLPKNILCHYGNDRGYINLIKADIEIGLHREIKNKITLISKHKKYKYLSEFYRQLKSNFLNNKDNFQYSKFRVLEMNSKLKSLEYKDKYDKKFFSPELFQLKLYSISNFDSNWTRPFLFTILMIILSEIISNWLLNIDYNSSLLIFKPITLFLNSSLNQNIVELINSSGYEYRRYIILLVEIFMFSAFIFLKIMTPIFLFMTISSFRKFNKY